MIRQRFLLAKLLHGVALLCATMALPGCVSVQSSGGGRVTYWVVPGLESGEQTNRAGTTYYNQRWGSSPDTHPAVSGAARSGAHQVIDSEGNTAQSGSGSASHGSAPVPVYPPYGTRTSGEVRADGQTAGAVVGALIGAQAGNRAAGVVAGSAIGALAGGKLADPCQPDANAGSLWGALAGGWLGSLFGGGRSRDFFIALGAAGGAVRGTEMWGDGRRCR